MNIHQIKKQNKTEQKKIKKTKKQKQNTYIYFMGEGVLTHEMLHIYVPICNIGLVPLRFQNKGNFILVMNITIL